MALRIKYLFVGVIVLTLFGCASGATKEGMTYMATTPVNFSDALQGQVAVDKVEGGKSTNPMWSSQISDEAFAGALRASLEALGLLSDDGHFKLRVTLQEVDQPVFGFDMTVTTVVRYELIDARTSQRIFDETIEAKHTATTSDAFAGVKRLQLANEGSAKNNIAEFIDRLSEITVSAEQVSLVF